MDNKKLGFIILSFSMLAALLAFGFMGSLNSRTGYLQCYPTQECQMVQSLTNLSHIAVGLISFIAALGIYLLFFSVSEQAVLDRLEEEKNLKIEQEKFELMLKSMDDSEKTVLRAVREQQGITQLSLRYKTDLSKAKLSQILTSFEEKNLIKRESQGKTYSVHLLDNLGTNLNN